MPSLTTSPATPRNDAADRYSPDTAAEFSSGDTLREATRKSEVVRIAATPRRPISNVISTTGATANAKITCRLDSRDSARDAVAPAGQRLPKSPVRDQRPAIAT